MRGRILLVDDDRAFRVSTAALLRHEGFDIVEAGDGQEAMDAMEAGEFALVILDMRMPGIDGIDLVEVLRTRGEHTPILMISGHGTVDAAVRALHVGADDFLTKPVEPDVLLERAGRLVSNRPVGEGLVTRFGITGSSEAMRSVLAEVEKVGPLRHHGADHGGDGDREGVGRPGRPPGVGPARWTVRPRELRRLRRESSGVRALRAHEGSLYRRRPRQGGVGTGRRGGNSLPR